MRHPSRQAGFVVDTPLVVNPLGDPVKLLLLSQVPAAKVVRLHVSTVKVFYMGLTLIKTLSDLNNVVVATPGAV